MSWIMIDIESDGPIPGDYSMLSFGAVIVDEKLNKTFYSTLKSISEKYEPEGVKFHGFTREESLKFPDPKNVMKEFVKWVKENSKGVPIFISDNNGYDWMFVCWYLWHFLNENPFGYSSRNMNDIYKGLVKDTSKNFKHLRTLHTHNALDDAIGNAQVLLKLKKELGLRIDI